MTQLPPPPSVKSPRGPDHSEANMWFELASQKQALHTWGCLRSSLVSLCSLCVCLCVCMLVCQFLSLWRGCVCVCVCVCSSNSTAGNKGQLKSQHIVSLETWWKNNKRPKKNLLNLSCLFQLFSISFFFLDLNSSFFRSLTTSCVHACVIKALQLFRASVSPLCLCAGRTEQQPGGDFGFCQSLSAQHLRKQSRREKRTSSFQLFSPCLIIWLTFCRCSRLAQYTRSHKSPSKRPLWFVSALVKSFSDWTERFLF